MQIKFNKEAIYLIHGPCYKANHFCGRNWPWHTLLSHTHALTSYTVKLPVNLLEFTSFIVSQRHVLCINKLINISVLWLKSTLLLFILFCCFTLKLSITMWQPDWWNMLCRLELNCFDTVSLIEHLHKAPLVFSCMSADKWGTVVERWGTACWARLAATTTWLCYQRQHKG